MDPAKPFGMIFAGIIAMKFDDLIGLNSLGFVGLLGIQPTEPKIALVPNYEIWFN